MAKTGSKEKIRKFLLANIGRVIESHEIFAASGGAGQYGRRLRELRDQEGWPILSHHDNSNLKPGQYLLQEKPPPNVVFSPIISARLRAMVLDRNGFTCQMCGLTPGDVDPFTGRKARLHIGHIVDRSHGGKNELSNLRALCSTCNQGAKNITTEKPSLIWLLTQVRRAGIDDQKAVYNWLHNKINSRD
ncbi:HNH endonuclease [Candidatus Magnetominusculus xianensis]|uniref:HNH endonuclease n=1 Tax=Candidatus Magnetominusculus xianensis TaxID=1748249 RepID=A0ABR5SBW9_9BACT|nr:HNH endonuclease [Candidatus Magnetominusculus xianensis]KWT78343.1 HNH endonuclease [Candidatus Magnetominusculus xianensis]MBF0402881.1 HNH endonuclease [Nitrospirota bacterium]